MTPTTHGTAAEVPENEAIPEPSVQAELMPTPGAARLISPPVLENPAALALASTAPTAMTLSYAAG